MFWNSQHLRSSERLFMHLCDILFLSLLFSCQGEDINIAFKVFGVIYLYLCNRILNLDLHILQMIIRKPSSISELLQANYRMLLLVVIVLQVHILFLPILYDFKSLQMVVGYNAASPFIFKKLFSYFLDMYIATDRNAFGAKFISVLYTICKLLHAIFLLVFVFVIVPFTFKCKYINYLHHDYGVVHYNTTNIDGNGIRKCEMIEYLILNDLHLKLEKVPLRSDTRMCTAIAGEYVTLSCNTTVHGHTNNDVVFIWLKNGTYIRTSKRQNITSKRHKSYLSKKTILVSSLTINRISKHDYNTYKCILHVVKSRKQSVKLKFFSLVFKPMVCIGHDTSEALAASEEFTLAAYKGVQHTIHAPMGYLLKLQNVFPLRVKKNVRNTIFVNDMGSFDLPFKLCFVSVVKFYNLKQDNSETHQFHETRLCLLAFYGRYNVKIEFGKGVKISHPNSLNILPVRQHNSFVNSYFFSRADYRRIASSASSHSKPNDSNKFFISISAGIFYEFIETYDRFIWIFLNLSHLVALFMEFKLYTCLLSFLRKCRGFESHSRSNDVNAVNDIFLSFCEQGLTDQAFAQDKLLPYLEHVHHYKVKSCHLINAGSSLIKQHFDDIQKCKKVVILWSNDYAEDSECQNIISQIILCLHYNNVLNLTDIITVKYLSHHIHSRYSFILENCSVYVPDDSDDSLDTINECIRSAFSKDKNIIDKIRSNFIIRLANFVFSLVINCLSFRKGKYLAVIVLTLCLYYYLVAPN